MTLRVDERIAGCLLGGALGDAVGLPCEGMSARRIARQFGRIERFRLLGATGYVSDDTEQSALVAQAIARHPSDAGAAALDFQRALLGWFLRGPWGIGLATIRACLKILLGFRSSGVRSAGCGAAMRSPVVGAIFAEDVARRRTMAQALAEVTHTDPRAVSAAVFTADAAAACALAAGGAAPTFDDAIEATDSAPLREALRRAALLARGQGGVEPASREIGTSGFAVHAVPFALFCFLRHRGDPMASIRCAVEAGGDTDTIAAIAGSWCGALRGERGLPAGLLDRIQDGPFGPSHLRGLAHALAEGDPPPRWSPARAMARNALLAPVILAHGLRRLLPPW